MRNNLSVFLLVLSCGVVHAQKITGHGRKVYHEDGTKMKDYEVISRDSRLRVGKKGNLRLEFRKWTIELTEPGDYSVDSLIVTQIYNPEYRLHDSLYSVLERVGLHECNFPYKFGPIRGSGFWAPVHADGVTDDIRILRDQIIRTPSDTVQLKWSHPESGYAGKYYLVIRSLFDNIIDIKIITSRTFILDLRPFRKKREPGVLYTLISEDCRETQQDGVIRILYANGGSIEN